VDLVRANNRRSNLKYSQANRGAVKARIN